MSTSSPISTIMRSIPRFLLLFLSLISELIAEESMKTRLEKSSATTFVSDLILSEKNFSNLKISPISYTPESLITVRESIV